MFVQEKRRNMRNTVLILDALHIIIGIVVVVLAVISFLNPEGNMALFPIIFLLAAILNISNGIHSFTMSDRGKKRKISALVTMILGFLLIVLAVVSAVSIWWR